MTLTDDLTKMLVALALVECNEKIVDATSGFVNPDNLLDLPDELRAALQEVVVASANLAELSSAYLEQLNG